MGAWQNLWPIRLLSRTSCKGAGKKTGVEEALGGGTGREESSGEEAFGGAIRSEQRGGLAEPMARNTSVKTSCKGAGKKIGVEEALGGGTGREESSGEEAFGGAVRSEQRRWPGRTYGP